MKWELEYIVKPDGIGPVAYVKGDKSWPWPHLTNTAQGMLKEETIEGDSKVVMNRIRELFKKLNIINVMITVIEE
jgi:hypothetical protein